MCSVKFRAIYRIYHGTDFQRHVRFLRGSSQGSSLNICQMIASVGQQTVSGKRAPEGFIERTLPHYLPKSKDPPSRGFVANR